MTQSRSALIGTSLIALLTLLAKIGVDAMASGGEVRQAGRETVQEAAPAVVAAAPEVQVTLAALNHTTSWDAGDVEREKFELPVLYLHREREAAAEAERTLEVQITGLAAGAEIQVEALSWHVDRSSGERHNVTTHFVAPDQACSVEEPCTVRWTWDAATSLSDFYALRVENVAGEPLWESPHPERPDFVALDTWEVGVDDYTVRIYYATLFPFAKGENDLENRLAPGAVTDFIEYVFVAMVVDTWHTQFEEWGFGDPMHPDWDGDKVVEIIVTAPPLALLDGVGPYTVCIDGKRQPYPERRIWWPASSNNYQAYDFLANGYKVTFAHEFFHMAQWNVLLGTGRPTQFAHNVFLEAQAGFAPSVQYPEIEIEERHVVSDISAGRAANRFLTGRLNSSYRELEAERVFRYDAGLYWRFLYEAYGDMGVIRAALEEMARHYSPDTVGLMDDAMDAALARLDGPFGSYEESLVAFARANYGLRLENGHCAATDLTACGEGYYDPKGVYADPALEAKLTVGGGGLTYEGGIPASYGMDFLEVQLDPALEGQPLTVTFQGQGAVARFNVQVWRLGDGEAKPHAVTAEPEVVPPADDGAHVYVIPAVDRSAYRRLALIVTRLDADETADAMGSYRITLETTSQAVEEAAVE
jgi:hypothetical protein